MALGYNTTHYESIGETELQNIYDALSDGAFLYKRTMVQGNLDSGHAVVVYGVNDIGELLVTDSAPFNNLVGVYENLTYTMPIQALDTSQCDVIIVQKTTSRN